MHRRRRKRPADTAMSNLSDEELIRRAIDLASNANPADDDEYWSANTDLHRRATRAIFERAAILCGDQRPELRVLGCDVLGQLGYATGHPFADETLPILERLCADQDSCVVGAAITAVGHMYRPEALDAVLPLADHPDPAVRFAVARALPSMDDGEPLGPTHPLVAALMTLTTDADTDVRDWATFGLGTCVHTDGVSIRECLRARLNDHDDDTRAEAIAGLARRHDPGIVVTISEALKAELVGRMAIESAAQLGDPDLFEPLQRLAEWWDDDDSTLLCALRRCDSRLIAEGEARLEQFLEAAAMSDLAIGVATDRFPSHCDAVNVLVSNVRCYDLAALLTRAQGSAEGAIHLIEHDETATSMPTAE
jgi:hypothetical protein